MTELPPPNLHGTYEDSCAVCMRGTDSGLAFKGEAEWAVAGLFMLGIPEDQAATMVSSATGCEPGEVPPGEVTVSVRVCRECAEASPTGMKVGLIATGIPVYSPMG